VIGGLLRLVTVDEQGRPTRWRVDRGELPEPVRVELDTFVARRLLTTDTDNGTVILGVTHEAFLSAWPPLAAAITAAASALRMRQAVEQAAAEWDDDGRPPSRLWERGQLAAAVNAIGVHLRPASPSGGQPLVAAATLPPPLLGWLPAGSRVLITERVELSQRARAFLHTSIRVDRRRRRRATTILSVLLVLAVAAAGVAVNRQRAAERQRRAAQLQQRIATAHGLVAQASAVGDNDSRIALQLALAADRIHADDETRAGLVDTLLATRWAATLTGRHSYPVTEVVFAPDGRTLATGSYDTVLLWDLSDRTRPRRLGQPLTGQGDQVVFAPDGRTLATGSYGTVLLWDLSDRTRPRRLGQPLTGHSDQVASVAFAPDGRTLATGSAATVILWDLSERTRPRRLGQPLTGRRLAAHSGPVHEVAFAPDGGTLATSSNDTVLLWDLSDRSRPQRLGQPLTGHSDQVASVAFAPDGRTLASGSADGTVILWDLTELDDLRRRAVQRACSLTGRGLNADEWARYVPGLPYQNTCPS
jgi:hypothetical protein